MTDFTYTTQRQYTGPAEWWYVVPSPYTPTDLARAQAAYMKRFGDFPSTPRKLVSGNKVLLAYPIPAAPAIEPEPDEPEPGEPDADSDIQFAFDFVFTDHEITQ